MISSLFLKRRQGGNPLPADYKGWPRSDIVEDPAGQGKIGVEMYDTYMSPGGQRLAEVCTSLLGLVIGLDMMILAFAVQTWEFLIGAVAGLAGFLWLEKYFFLWLFSSVIWVRIFEDRFEIPESGRFKKYDITQIRAISGDTPPRAVQEETQAQRNVNTGRYYRDSERVRLESAGNITVLCCVYPKDDAEKIANRLRGIWRNLGSAIV